MKQRSSYFDLSQPLHTLEGWVVVVVGLGGGVGVVLSWGVVVVFCPPKMTYKMLANITITSLTIR